MARYIDEAKLIQALVKERDKIPLTIPCASYELLDEKPNSVGQSQRAGIRKALRCIAEAPTADVVEVVRCKDCKYLNVLNLPTLYAYCEKARFRFEPFEMDTRTHFCSYGERKEKVESIHSSGR